MTAERFASPPHWTGRGGFQLGQIRSERAERYADSLLGPSLGHRSGHQASPCLPEPQNWQSQVRGYLHFCGSRHQLWHLPESLPVLGRRGSSLTCMCGHSVSWRNLNYCHERPSTLGWGRAGWVKRITPSAREPGLRNACAPFRTFWSGTIIWMSCRFWKLWTRWASFGIGTASTCWRRPSVYPAWPSNSKCPSSRSRAYTSPVSQPRAVPTLQR